MSKLVRWAKQKIFLKPNGNARRIFESSGVKFSRMPEDAVVTEETNKSSPQQPDTEESPTKERPPLKRQGKVVKETGSLSNESTQRSPVPGTSKSVPSNTKKKVLRTRKELERFRSVNRMDT